MEIHDDEVIALTHHPHRNLIATWSETDFREWMPEP